MNEIAMDMLVSTSWPSFVSLVWYDIVTNWSSLFFLCGIYLEIIRMTMFVMYCVSNESCDLFLYVLTPVTLASG